MFSPKKRGQLSQDQKQEQPRHDPFAMSPEGDMDDSIDPELRLRTVRTAASTIELATANEERQHRRRKFLSISRGGRNTKRKDQRKSSKSTTSLTGVAELSETNDSTVEFGIHGSAKEKKEDEAEIKGGKRRTVYVNWPLPPDQMYKGDPVVTYVRNKVRTSKYTILTFLPKNLLEQFRRVANMYFLLLVILQVFSIFGATTPQIAMLPLVAILCITGIKDGIEDYRRAMLDEEVNNSAATKLGSWRNVNQPDDPRTTFEKIIGVKNPHEKISKGVKKLREKEAKEGKEIVMMKMDRDENAVEALDESFSSASGDARRDYHLDDVVSVNGSEAELYPGPIGSDHPDFRYLNNNRTHHSNHSLDSSIMGGGPATRTTSRRSAGVVNWDKQTAGTAKWERTLWKKLEVGDVVLLRENEQIPADVIVLSTSDPDGVCYVETKNLDGETNLKVRKALKSTSSINQEEDIEHARFMVDSEPPHANLYTYTGLLKYQSSNLSDDANELWKEKLEPISINELLLRGCTLRNSKWVIGLVLFTGADTKIMMNGGETPSKRSKIEKETNFNVIVNFIILMVCCATVAAVYGWEETVTGRSESYYEDGTRPSSSNAVNAIVMFVSGLIVFQNIVPISLYISIELVKTIQAFFIFQDVDMYYEPLDVSCVPKTWDISDDLGQIEYIFSDKTGTLTQNVMEFKKFSVSGIAYGDGFTEAMLGAAKREGRDGGMDMEEQEITLAASKVTMLDRMKKAWKNRFLQDDKLTCIAPELPLHLSDQNNPQRQALINFFRALAICHSVLADKPDPEARPHFIDYKAESPDEAALVAAARDMGFPFIHKNNHHLDIEVLGQAERYTPLKMLEFNSTRKRMSVIVRSPEGRIILYCKGADSIVMARLRPDHDPALKATTQKDLETFANAGLRTLLISYKYLDEQEYQNWARQYDDASNAIVDREEEMEKVAEVIEHGLTILGATALEDKLQEGVPSTIETLHQAGIKLWVLTGDKVQTAIEIAFSCNLLSSEMEIFILSAENEDGARAQVEAALNKMASTNGPPELRQKRSSYGVKANTQFAVVVDGDTLRFILESTVKQLFLALTTQCETVVCCRVSPAQKAQTVLLIKDGIGAMTLAIGDGANDVSMIQAAHIGIGLYGHEGSQAAMSADYAFGQFRFLTKLLLVHGHWSYVRIAEMHANFFYKNIIWTFCLFWYCIFNEWEATYLFEYTFILLFNLVFTSLPVIIMGAFDQDVNKTALLAFPRLYERGIKGLEYTRVKFFMYMLDGLYQSLICFFIPYFAYHGGTSWSSNGLDTDGIYDLGTTIAAATIIAANCFVGLNSKYWTVITWVIIVVSSLCCFLWIAIYSAFDTYFFNEEALILFSTFNFWGLVVFVTVAAVGPHYVFSSIISLYFPSDKTLVREAWIGGDLKRQLGVPRGKARRAAELAERDLEGNPDSLYPLQVASFGSLSEDLDTPHHHQYLPYSQQQQTLSPYRSDFDHKDADSTSTITQYPNQLEDTNREAALTFNTDIWGQQHDTGDQGTSVDRGYSGGFAV